MTLRRPVLIATIAVLALTLLRAQAGTGSTVTHPYVGITYIDRREAVASPGLKATPRAVHTHVVQVDLTAPGIRFTLSPPAGSRETVRQTTLEFLKQEHAQFAINAHFFLPFPSTDAEAWLIGLAASDGRVFSAFETPEQSYALMANAPAINIDRTNHASVVHRDPSKADGLHVIEPVELWTTISGSAQIVTDGVASIPTYKDARHPEAPLTPGSARNYANGNSWYDVVTARSAIGLSRDNRTVTLFTVDVRGGSDGMRVGEVAAVLIKDYGVWNALNIDGGGSTSLAMADPATGIASLVNTSSDSAQGRSVGSSLVVFARTK